MALEVEKYLAVEAKERQGARNDITQRFAESVSGEAREQAARMVGTRYHPGGRLLPNAERPKLAPWLKAGESWLAVVLCGTDYSNYWELHSF